MGHGGHLDVRGSSDCDRQLTLRMLRRITAALGIGNPPAGPAARTSSDYAVGYRSSRSSRAWAAAHRLGARPRPGWRRQSRIAAAIPCSAAQSPPHGSINCVTICQPTTGAWQRPFVEGVGPLEHNLALSLANAADKSYREIQLALRPLRGDGAIPPIALIAIGTTEDYYSFISAYHGDEGEYATSGGVYVNLGPEAFPFVAFPTQPRDGSSRCDRARANPPRPQAVASPHLDRRGVHADDGGACHGSFRFSCQSRVLDRHRERWEQSGLERFWSGESFHSPHENEQELAYHLSQLVVRSSLSERAPQFFAFAKACRDAESTAEASRRTLGCEARGVGHQHSRPRRLAGPGILAVTRPVA